MRTCLFDRKNSVILMLAMLALLMESEYLLGLRKYAHDTIGLDFTSRVYLSDCLRSGVFPWWDSITMPGIPNFFYTSVIYYPVAVVLGWLTQYDLSSLKIEFVFLRFVALLGMYLWMRRQRVSVLLSLVAAVAFAGSGPLVTSRSNMSVCMVMSFIPWFFLSLRMILTALSEREYVGGTLLCSTVCWLMITGGYVGLTYPVFLSGGLYAFALALGRRERIGRSVICMLAAAVIVVLLLVLPLSEYLYFPEGLQIEGRPSDGSFNPYKGSLPAASLLSMFFPNSGYLPGVTVGRSEQMYIGVVLAICLLPCACIVKKKNGDWLLLGLAVVLFIAAMDGSFPPTRAIINFVPGLGLFRWHCFWSVLPVFFLVSFGGRLMDRFLECSEDNGPHRLFLVIVVMQMAVISVLPFLMMTLLSRGPLVVSVYEILMTLVLFILLILGLAAWFFVTAWRSGAKPERKRVSFTVMLLLIACVAVVWLLPLFVPAGFSLLERALVFVLKDVHSAAVLLERLRGTTSSIPFYHMFIIDAGQSFLVVCGLTMLVLQRARHGRRWVRTGLLLIMVLDMTVAGYRYFHGNPNWLGVPGREMSHSISVTSVQRAGVYKWKWQEGRGSPMFDRIPVIDGVMNVFSIREIKKMISEPDGYRLFERHLWWDSRLPASLADSGGIREIIPVSFELRPNEAQVILQSDEPGYLIWTDTWSKGWRAWVNGTEVTVYRAIGIVKGVQVPSGVVDVRFVYSPPFLIIGGASMIIGLLMLIGLLARYIYLSPIRSRRI